MAIISDVKRFKEISDTDNILVKENDTFKRSTFPEIANTLLKYIDIESLISEAIGNRDDFFDNFLSRGIYPFMRMACDVEILNPTAKTVRLVQRVLAANTEVRYKDIDEKYMSNAILEVYIEDFPSEITDRSEWRIDSIDSPINLQIRRKEAEVEEESYFYLNELTLGIPQKFSFYNFALRQTWSPILDSFSGRVEAYASSTGVDGYTDFIPTTIDGYLRFVSSMRDLTVLDENVSRGKQINLRENNLSTLRYIEENPTGYETKVSVGADIALGSSTVPTGQGVNNLGVKLITKRGFLEGITYRPGAQDIGTIKVSFDKSLFGLQEFEDDRFICASLDSDKIYNRTDFPEFSNKFSIMTSTFSVKDYVYKINNPYNLPLYKFKDFTLSHTTKTQEFGQINSGKLGVAFAGKTNFDNVIEPLQDRLTSDDEDFLISGRVVIGRPGDEDENTTFYRAEVKSWLDPTDGDYAEVISESTFENQTFTDVDSVYAKRTTPIGTFVDFTGNQMGVSQVNRKPDIGAIFYIPIGFKNPSPNKDNIKKKV